MSQTNMNSIPVPLPPVLEQRRIVAMVDELMALGYRLEASLVADACRRLLKALLAKAPEPTEERELDAAE